MTDSKRSLIFSVLVALSILGCEVTQEKIELWKGTVNGPKKLAGTVIDPDIDINLRAQAAVALVEINNWELFREAFTKIEKEEAGRVAGEVVPRLIELLDKGNAEKKTVSKLAVDAKDGLMMILDHTTGEGRKIAEDALIKWCVGDYNARAMAGQYNISTIVRKIGPRAAEALIPLLSVEELVIKHAAELIRKVDNPDTNAKASEHLAKELLANIPKIKEIHLITAAIIGGDAIASALLKLATDATLSAGLQRFALRAYSEGLAKKAIKPSAQQIDILFNMSESSDYDQYQREETYYVIAQAGRVEDIPRIKKLLASKSSFWRAVGFRCILRIDGENQLAETLREIARSRSKPSKDDIDEIIDRIISFPKLLPKVRVLLDDPSVFVKGIAVGVIGTLGTKEDIEKLKELSISKEKLPKQFQHKTLGEAATAALEAVTKRG